MFFNKISGGAVMKKLWMMVAIGTIMMTGISVGEAFAQEGKIGFVNLSRLFDEYGKTKEYDAKLEQKHSDFEEARNQRIEKIREAQGKLALLAEDRRTELETEIESMKADLLEFDRQQKADLTKERNDKIREILLEIENKVSEYAKKQDYTLILNDRFLIYGNKNIDLTEELLKILNKEN
jgi:outer membrane protein